MLVRSVVSFLVIWGVLHCLIQMTIGASWKQRMRVGKSLIYSLALALVATAVLTLVVQIF